MVANNIGMIVALGSDVENLLSTCKLDMKREHVFTRCTQCGWRQRSYAIKGKICFDEYYCKRCGGQLLICVKIRLRKGKTKEHVHSDTL